MSKETGMSSSNRGEEPWDSIPGELCALAPPGSTWTTNNTNQQYLPPFALILTHPATFRQDLDPRKGKSWMGVSTFLPLERDACTSCKVISWLWLAR